MVNYSDDAIEYIAKLADGGMRDAITMLDKCLAFSNDITLENVVKALGTANYETMFDLNDAIFDLKSDVVIKIIEQINMSGKDLKQFVRTYMNFLLDICKFDVLRTFDYLEMPNIYESELKGYGDFEFTTSKHLLDVVIKLNSSIKYETSPKSLIESTLLLECVRDD